MPNPGYIYILSNPSMPDLVKIGKTGRNVDDRINELNSTGVPESFKKEAIFEVQNMDEDEKIIHAKLEYLRPNKKREFFNIESPKAINEIIKIIGAFPKYIADNNLYKVELLKEIHEKDVLLGSRRYEIEKLEYKIKLLDDRFRHTIESLNGRLEYHRKFRKYACNRDECQIKCIDDLNIKLENLEKIRQENARTIDNLKRISSTKNKIGAFLSVGIFVIIILFMIQQLFVQYISNI